MANSEWRMEGEALPSRNDALRMRLTARRETRSPKVVRGVAGEAPAEPRLEGEAPAEPIYEVVRGNHASIQSRYYYHKLGGVRHTLCTRSFTTISRPFQASGGTCASA